MEKLGYLGPKGTFTEEAALIYGERRPFEYIEYYSIPELIYAVNVDKVDEVIVPVENSLEGTVNATIDMLIHEVNVKICGELVLPVQHCLMAKDEVNIDNLEAVLSHPQALAQCRKFIHNELNGVIVKQSTSTAAAAQMVKDTARPWAAIAGKRAASIFELNILKENIQENADNSTRFIILSKKHMQRTGNDKTSIVFSVNHTPGSLYEALKIFSDYGVNLTKIESRPMKTLLGQYLFIVDFEGHKDDEIVAKILKKLSNASKYYINLGSYPKIS